MADFAAAGAGWPDTYDLSTVADIAADWLACDDLDMSNCF